MENNFNLFITINYKTGCSEKKGRYLMTRIFNKVKDIKTMYWVSERNKTYHDIDPAAYLREATFRRKRYAELVLPWDL